MQKVVKNFMTAAHEDQIKPEETKTWHGPKLWVKSNLHDCALASSMGISRTMTSSSMPPRGWRSMLV